MANELTFRGFWLGFRLWPFGVTFIVVRTGINDLRAFPRVCYTCKLIYYPNYCATCKADTHRTRERSTITHLVGGNAYKWGYATKLCPLSCAPQGSHETANRITPACAPHGEVNHSGQQCAPKRPNTKALQITTFNRADSRRCNGARHAHVLVQETNPRYPCKSAPHPHTKIVLLAYTACEVRGHRTKSSKQNICRRTRPPASCSLVTLHLILAQRLY
jgi:hypothetical protein